MNIKKEFDIFKNQSWLTYLDSASSTQKPNYVLSHTSDYILNNYANIGRWQYSLAEKSDEYFFKTKEKIGELTNSNPKDIFFTYNATYGINIIWHALIGSGLLVSGDEIIVGIAEHHANILIWQYLAKKHNIVIKYLPLDDKSEYDIQNLSKIVSTNTKLIALGLSSNVLGNKNNLDKIRQIVWQDVIVVIDAAQAIAHYSIDINNLDCDICVRSAHKFFAYTGLGIVHIKKKLSDRISPTILWGGTIQDVDKYNYKLNTDISKREPGTPNIISIVSLYHAIDRRNSIDGYNKLEIIERDLIMYTLEKFEKLDKKVKLVNTRSENRIGIFAFETIGKNSNHINSILDQNNVCVRVGWHCAHPLHQELNIWSNIRLSLHIYNDRSDINKFFKVLESAT